MIAVEVQGFAAQNRIATTNSEVNSRGYVLASLLGNWQVADGLRLDFGIENLFNRQYLEHLAGYNRIRLSDVPVGARLSGPGRSAFIRLRWALRS
jgi:iron complex outermembrane receptor protein